MSAVPKTSIITSLGTSLLNFYAKTKDILLNNIKVITVASFALLGVIFGIKVGLIAGALFITAAIIAKYCFSSIEKKEKDPSSKHSEIKHLPLAKALAVCKRFLKTESIDAEKQKALIEEIQSLYSRSDTLSDFFKELENLIVTKEKLESSIHDQIRHRLSYHYVRDLLKERGYEPEKIKEILKVCKEQGWDDPLSRADLATVFEKGFFLLDERSNEIVGIYDIHYFTLAYLAMSRDVNPFNRQPLTPTLVNQICNYYEIPLRDFGNLRSGYSTFGRQNTFFQAISIKRYQEIVDNKADYPIDHIPYRNTYNRTNSDVAISPEDDPADEAEDDPSYASAFGLNSPHYRSPFSMIEREDPIYGVIMGRH